MSKVFLTLARLGLAGTAPAIAMLLLTALLSQSYSNNYTTFSRVCQAKTMKAQHLRLHYPAQHYPARDITFLLNVLQTRPQRNDDIWALNFGGIQDTGTRSPFVLLTQRHVNGIIPFEGDMGAPRRYTRAYAEEQAKLGKANEPVASTVYLTLGQLAKVERLIEKRQREDSEKLGRKVAPMSFADFIRVTIDGLAE